jgi:ParB/RepB/Spo0J family partition protein
LSASIERNPDWISNCFSNEIGVEKMSQDDDDDSEYSADDLPSFEDAVKQRKEHIAWLRKNGEEERANLLAQCRKHNRCYLDDCPVCERRVKLARSRLPKSAINYVTGCLYDRSYFVLGLDVNAIRIVGPRRRLDEKRLRELRASIAQIGLQTPITVRLKGKKAVLVAGLHRLVAMKQLGEPSIPCYEHNEDESESYLWQRSENIYRAELRVLDRADAINEMRQAIQQKGGQVAPPGGRQPKDIGIKKAAKALGLTRDEVRRAKAISGLIPEAKAAARKLGLDDNQRALLEVAKLPASSQCEAIKRIIDRQNEIRAGTFSRAVVTEKKEVVAKLQSIETNIANKEGKLESLKHELSKERKRREKVQDHVIEACLSKALVTTDGQVAPAINTDGQVPPAINDDVVVVRDNRQLSPNEETSLTALIAAWKKASALVHQRFIGMLHTLTFEDEVAPVPEE